MPSPGRLARTTARLEDLAWMIETGEVHVEALAARIGITPRTIARLLKALREDRPDLALRVDYGQTWAANK